jgi:hypothetical protein
VQDYVDQSYAALAAVNPNNSRFLDNLVVDGIIIADNNFFATDSLRYGKVNNVKVIGWNGNNDGLELGQNTIVTNVFVRSGDDSLKMWGDNITVKNATVWQNYNGGVVNLGWFKSPHEGGLIDGLYVVKTDWFAPAFPTIKADSTDILAHQNNAIIASLMVPGTEYGQHQPALYRNIFVEDTPQVLFSLKIVPPAIINTSIYDSVILTDRSTLNLNIENLFSPPSAVCSSIGFQTLPPGYVSYTGQNGGFTLGGNMTINLTNVIVVGATGLKPISTANSCMPGQIWINGNATVNAGATSGDELATVEEHLNPPSQVGSKTPSAPSRNEGRRSQEVLLEGFSHRAILEESSR